MEGGIEAIKWRVTLDRLANNEQVMRLMYGLLAEGSDSHQLAHSYKRPPFSLHHLEPSGRTDEQEYNQLD